MVLELSVAGMERQEGANLYCLPGERHNSK